MMVQFICNQTLDNSMCESIFFHPGAIDLAAKSAGIIPGSPCRELEAPRPDGRPLSTSHPGVVYAGPGPPQPLLLQQASSEVSVTLKEGKEKR